MNNEVENKLKSLISIYKSNNYDMNKCMLIILNEIKNIECIFKDNGINSAWILTFFAQRGIISIFDENVEKQEDIKNSFVYVIHSPKTKLTKIGYSSNINQRFNTLKNSTPDKLILKSLIRGTKDTEREMHNKYASKRKHGEWFNLDNDEILELESISCHEKVQPFLPGIH